MQRKGSSDENFRAENANVPVIYEKEEMEKDVCGWMGGGRANNIFTLIQSIIEVVISSRYCINKMDDRRYGFNEELRNFCCNIRVYRGSIGLRLNK